MLLQGRIQFRVNRTGPGGQHTVKILLDHRDGPADQVAQVVRQVRVHPGQEGLIGIVTVGAEGHLPHQVIAQRIHAVPCDNGFRINYIPLGLAHPVRAEQQPAVAEYLLRQGQAQGVQHDGPVDCMEPHDLFAHQMNVRRPVFPEQLVVFRAVAQCGNVVAERVDPDVYGMLLVKVHRHAPLHARTAHAKVLQARPQEVGQHLVRPLRRLDKVRMGLDIVDQPVLVFAHLEEIAFLPHGLAGASAVRADFHAVLLHQLSGRPEAFAGRTVHSFVLGLINIPLLIELAEDLLYDLHMPLFCGADKIIVLNVHKLPEILRLRHDLVHILDRGHARFGSLLFDLLAVLIRTGQKICVVSLHLSEPGHGVRSHGCIGVADGHVAGRIIDRRGDVEGFLGLTHGSFLL